MTSLEGWGSAIELHPHSRKQGIGAVDETRTRDLNLGKVALYQLSYYRTWCGRRDLNSYARRHQILSLARLPFRHVRKQTFLSEGW